MLISSYPPEMQIWQCHHLSFHSLLWVYGTWHDFRGTINEHFWLIILLCQEKNRSSHQSLISLTAYDKTRVDKALKFHLKPISGSDGIRKWQKLWKEYTNSHSLRNNTLVDKVQTLPHDSKPRIYRPSSPAPNTYNTSSMIPLLSHTPLRLHICYSCCLEVPSCPFDH